MAIGTNRRMTVTKDELLHTLEEIFFAAGRCDALVPAKNLAALTRKFVDGAVCEIKINSPIIKISCDDD